MQRNSTSGETLGRLMQYGFFKKIIVLVKIIRNRREVKKQEEGMGVKKTGEKYRCNVCGNEVVVTKVGGGELVCCNKPMEKIEG